MQRAHYSKPIHEDTSPRARGVRVRAEAARSLMAPGHRGLGAATWRVSVRQLLAVACAAVVSLLAGRASAADSPGVTLRQYLDARWRGDLTAAQALWDPVDLRRSEALGTRYAGLEARFDDNLLYRATDWAAAKSRRPAVRDSSVEAGWARYTVLVPGPGTAVADTLTYFLQKGTSGWLVTSPFAKLTAGWTARETRFFRVRATRLRDVNKDALAALDATIASACERLGVPEVGRLRLERIKIEYYLCDSDATLRQLGVAPRQAGYRLAGERVVTRHIADSNAASRVLVHLAMKDAPRTVTAFVDAGLAAALGGTATESAGVVMQRGAAAAVSAADPTAVFDATASTPAPPKNALAFSAFWCDALLRELGPARFAALYRKLAVGPDQTAFPDAAAVRREIESATAKRGPALVAWLREASAGFVPPLAAGCRSIPEETRTTAPVLRWRDAQERWSLEGFTSPEGYTVTMGPYGGPMPKWAQRLADSVATAQGMKPDTTHRRNASARPPGDPPQIAILLRERLVLEPDAYESRLFHEHFANRRYAGDLYGLFVGPGEARLYDYRRDLLVGVYTPDLALPKSPVYYDEPAGRLCFRVSGESLLKPIVEYMAVCLPYTGE
jgi:hypothetical protein